jgi:DNA mismatch repair protein MutL
VPWAEVKPQTGVTAAALKRFPGEGAASQPEAPPAGAPARDSLPLLNIPLRLVGVIGRLYVVLESDRGLVLMDQHAAHERILFEQMLNRLEAGEVPAQRLLLPETVELSVRDAQFLREQLPALARLGVGLSEFSEQTFLLDACLRWSRPRIRVASFSSWWMRSRPPGNRSTHSVSVSM